MTLFKEYKDIKGDKVVARIDDNLLGITVERGSEPA